jgi:ABC-type transport system involved in cytochrome bd biosynthesis fused ATPase/permease subunit
MNTLMAKAAFGITLDLRKRAYGHLLSLSGDRLSQMQLGDLSYRLTEDIDKMRSRSSDEAEFNRQAKYLTEKINALQHPIVSFLQVVSILFIFVLAGIQISAGNLTSAEFVIYLTNIVLIISPIATKKSLPKKKVGATLDYTYLLSIVNYLRSLPVHRS